MERPYIRDSDGSQRPGRAILAGSRWDLRIDQSELTFLRVDHQTRLQFGETEVVIESPFALRSGDHEYHLDPSERSGLGPLLSVYPNALTSAYVDIQATLRLKFSDGTTVTVPADPHYEAWQVNGPGTFLVVCVPGTSGELAIWE